MLTAHECIRALAEIRAATPRVRYRWPHTPNEIDISVAALSIHLFADRDRWMGWAFMPGGPALLEPLNEAPWPRAFDDRVIGEIEAVLGRSGIDGHIDRSTFGQMPF